MHWALIFNTFSFNHAEDLGILTSPAFFTNNSDRVFALSSAFGNRYNHPSLNISSDTFLSSEFGDDTKSMTRSFKLIEKSCPPLNPSSDGETSNLIAALN